MGRAILIHNRPFLIIIVPFHMCGIVWGDYMLHLHPSISTVLMRPRRPKQYCLQLDITLWHTKLCFHVQIEHSPRMSRCYSINGPKLVFNIAHTRRSPKETSDALNVQYRSYSKQNYIILLISFQSAYFAKGDHLQVIKVIKSYKLTD